MYRLARTGSDPAPLDFNRDTPTEGIADARDFEPCPNGLDEPFRFNTESLLAEIGLSAQAVREIQPRSSDPGL